MRNDLAEAMGPLLSDEQGTGTQSGSGTTKSTDSRDGKVESPIPAPPPTPDSEK